MNKKVSEVMKKSYVVAMCLIGIVLILSIGFAVFSSRLTMNRSGKDNTWNVEITDITSKDIIGSASDAALPVYTKTSATFKTVLTTPGDSITYDVTVKNKGVLDAKVNKITLTDSKNPAITFETSGINENDLLKAGETQVFTVIVSYNKDIIGRPSELKASLTVKLDYVQNK